MGKSAPSAPAGETPGLHTSEETTSILAPSVPKHWPGFISAPAVVLDMSQESPIKMAADERDAFLKNGGTGVLSLAAGDESPHSVPVSYGYDASTETFYFRLAVGAGSSKGDIDDGRVSFVTYDETAEGWRSVIASGRLEHVESDGIEIETLEGLDRVEIPLVDIFDAPLREVSFQFYRLVPDELTTRVEA